MPTGSHIRLALIDVDRESNNIALLCYGVHGSRFVHAVLEGIALLVFDM